MTRAGWSRFLVPQSCGLQQVPSALLLAFLSMNLVYPYPRFQACSASPSLPFLDALGWLRPWSSGTEQQVTLAALLFMHPWPGQQCPLGHLDDSDLCDCLMPCLTLLIRQAHPTST